MLKLARQAGGPGPVGAPIAGTPHVPGPHNQLWRTTQPLEYVAAFNPRKNFSPSQPGLGPLLSPERCLMLGLGLPWCPQLPCSWLVWDRPWPPGPAITCCGDLGQELMATGAGVGSWAEWGEPWGAGVACRDMMENRQVGRCGCIL